MLKMMLIGLAIIFIVGLGNKLIGVFLHSPNKAGLYLTLLILVLTAISIKNKRKRGNHE